MTNPWGLSGPEFLGLYICGLVVACVATLVLRKRIRSGSARRSPEPLTVDETAFIAGGWVRVVESALANLVAHNVIRVQREGLLYPVSDARAKPESTLEERLANRVTKRQGRPLPYHLSSMSNLPEYDAIRRSLAAKGLYYYGSNRRQALVAALPLVVLLVIGIARWINGVNLGFPVGYLTGLLILTVIVTLFAMREIKEGLTSGGKRALDGINRGVDAAAAVAKDGMQAYPDVTISRLLQEARRRPSRSRGSTYAGSSFVFFGGGASTCSSGGGSSCSSGGSSCGGGGGCGGGGS
ncbi:TIGR04222 domain-containing membrane protein [Kibdelosporangium philippinense]|uniref:TIGR04222 domain-containing membrane protein n=1 Tax=Kibdelosporangium philippinense TaxID=211113 RepID=A0ABS8ZPP7_9PSEU|nr:TIGR04222 domain-containing membrane protein [Kibdelosporangium philippinense]MCE7009721.1 TIGR04222 domain-containing membrane protein [Kibdelosporangium philippinense]